MKKETSCTALPGVYANQFRRFSITGAASRMLAAVESSKPVAKLADLYSLLLEERVSPRRALHLLNASAAATLLLCVNVYSTVAMLLLLAWTLAAINGCRKCRR